jgi:hypothetical protein
MSPSMTPSRSSSLTSLLLAIALACSVAACDSGTVGGGASCEAGPCGTDSSPGQEGLVFPDGPAPADGAADSKPGCAVGTTECGSTCCTADQICQQGKCEDLGYACDELWPCPPGFNCDDVLGRCVPGASKCEYRPKPGVFTPKVEWEWTGSTTLPAYNQVMMAPMVANLNDDNQDGKIDRNDIPDIVFHTYKGSNYQSDGVLRVLSGDGKKEHLTITDPAHRTAPGTQVALADIDNDMKVEIIACASGGGTIAFENDGTFKWKSTASCYAPSVVDLDGDGSPEVLVQHQALEGKTGVIRWTGAKGCGNFSTAADINDDGKPEVVCGRVVYTWDGKVLWNDTSRDHGRVAIADLDGDGKPEIITTVSSEHALYAHDATGKKIFGPIDINQGKADPNDQCGGCGGGPPTIADFDGDGKPEIAAAAGYGYVIFEHDGTPKWFKATQDKSSRATGSSVFDFEGDGKAEVVYSDELVLRIYEGSTGKVLFSHCNTSGTLQEYPLIVDVDNDDHAEIVVANNNYAFKTCGDGSASKTGIKVLADAQNNWVRTRRIWNQHTYHVTNIDEDGRVPKVEKQNWKNPVLNNFRQNVQPNGLFDAPDLTGLAPKQPTCTTRVTAEVTVQNEGAAKVVAGVKVTLYLVDSAGDVPLQTKTTQTVIYPKQSEVVSFDVKLPAAYNNKQVELYAVVDDDGTVTGQIIGTVNECKEGNNRVEVGKVQCKGIG